MTDNINNINSTDNNIREIEEQIKSILPSAQEYVSKTYSGILSEHKDNSSINEDELKSYIDQYIKANKVNIIGYPHR